MSEVTPRCKSIEYDILIVTVNYDAKELVVTNSKTGETITIPSAAFPELQSIVSDIARQPPTPDSNSQKGK